jgi:hypothetical protein
MYGVGRDGTGTGRDGMRSDGMGLSHSNAWPGTASRRYVHDIVIIFDQNKINENLITNDMNNIHKYLEFKLTAEENKNTNYLDGDKNNPQMRIYIKPTQTYTTIHFTSNHPL